MTQPAANLLRWYRRHRALRKLAQDVERRANSFEVIDYRKRRAAALKGLGR
ncbi:MAG TPA: hypothetical protein VF389_11775 [Woeseiaceae bacterium]